MLKLAICGSREISLSPSQLDALIYTFFTPDPSTLSAEIVSGGARGMDTSAKEYAKTFEFDYKEFPADWDKYGKGAGFVRNIQIAQYADKLLVIRYPDSNGSKHVSLEFKKLNKPVYEIILPKMEENV